MDVVIYLDLMTFAVAFFALLVGVKLPLLTEGEASQKESFEVTVKSGLRYLRDNR